MSKVEKISEQTRSYLLHAVEGVELRPELQSLEAELASEAADSGLGRVFDDAVASWEVPLREPATPARTTLLRFAAAAVAVLGVWGYAVREDAGDLRVAEQEIGRMDFEEGAWSETEPAEPAAEAPSELGTMDFEKGLLSESQFVL